jgi:hypothetical protein
MAVRSSIKAAGSRTCWMPNVRYQSQATADDMKLPIELLHHIVRYLDPVHDIDLFHALRRTSRIFFSITDALCFPKHVTIRGHRMASKLLRLVQFNPARAANIERLHVSDAKPSFWDSRSKDKIFSAFFSDLPWCKPPIKDMLHSSSKALSTSKTASPFTIIIHQILRVLAPTLKGLNLYIQSRANAKAVHALCFPDITFSSLKILSIGFFVPGSQLGMDRPLDRVPNVFCARLPAIEVLLLADLAKEFTHINWRVQERVRIPGLSSATVLIRHHDNERPSFSAWREGNRSDIRHLPYAM